MTMPLWAVLLDLLCLCIYAAPIALLVWWLVSTGKAASKYNREHK